MISENKLMPTDKIILTLIQELYKRKKTYTEIANLLIEKNEPFFNKHYKTKFVHRVAFFINLAIDLEYQKAKKSQLTVTK